MPPRIPYKQIKDYPWFLRILFAIQRKKFGQILNPTLLWGYSPWQTIMFILFYQVIERKKSCISPAIRSLAMVRVAQVNGCHYCVDINSLLLMERLQSQEKVLAVSSWRESALFSQQEKGVLEYAEAMSGKENEVTDELILNLQTFFNPTQIIELTGIIAFQNMSARFNSSLRVPEQGFCVLPTSS
ncbi:MAG: carboxymuconolactone decarboxylase family protein [Proteobacteria bacterium]|nr:carboxymuconolactone decarboxylase family protein [Pseudomonadota bacterium]